MLDDIVMSEDDLLSLESVSKNCLCFQARMTSRTITRLYNSTLSPIGLDITEFSLLAAIARGKTESVTALADRLAFERTTLVRHFSRLLKRGLIKPTSQKGRASSYQLTASGRSLIERAVPIWKTVQSMVNERLVANDRADMLASLISLRDATHPSAA